jgi:hypothetical protein
MFSNLSITNAIKPTCNSIYNYTPRVIKENKVVTLALLALSTLALAYLIKNNYFTASALPTTSLPKTRARET